MKRVKDTDSEADLDEDSIDEHEVKVPHQQPVVPEKVGV